MLSGLHVGPGFPAAIVFTGPPPKQCTTWGEPWEDARQCFVLSMTPRTWENAKDFCRSMGGWLAELYTYEADSIVMDMLREAKFYNDVWIGAARGTSSLGPGDITHEVCNADISYFNQFGRNLWFWSGSQTPVCGPWWISNQPNNLVSLSTGNGQDCGEILRDDTGYLGLNDHWCDLEYISVCDFWGACHQPEGTAPHCLTIIITLTI